MNIFLLLLLALAFLAALGVLIIPAIVNLALKAMAVLLERGDSHDC